MITGVITGFDADQAQAGSTADITYMSPDLNFVVKCSAQNTPEEPAEPEIPAVPEKPAEKLADNNKLPQTGANDATAIAGLGLLTAVMSLFGFGKRKSRK